MKRFMVTDANIIMQIKSVLGIRIHAKMVGNAGKDTILGFWQIFIYFKVWLKKSVKIPSKILFNKKLFNSVQTLTFFG